MQFLTFRNNFLLKLFFIEFLFIEYIEIYKISNRSRCYDNDRNNNAQLISAFASIDQTKKRGKKHDLCTTQKSNSSIPRFENFFIF